MGAEEIRRLKSVAENKKIEKEKRKLSGLPTEQQRWYSRILATEKRVCWETGDPISEDSMFASIAHIFPKSKFESVKTHPLNYLILNVWGGVHDRTHRWDTFQKMKVFPLALERMILIEPNIAPEERKNIPQFLLDEIEKGNPFKETKEAAT